MLPLNVRVCFLAFQTSEVPNNRYTLEMLIHAIISARSLAQSTSVSPKQFFYCKMQKLKESSVIEVLRNISFKTLFSVCLYFSRLRVWFRILDEHTPFKAFFLKRTRQPSFLQNLSFHLQPEKRLKAWAFLSYGSPYD